MATFKIDIGTDYIEVWLTGLQENYAYIREYDLSVYEYNDQNTPIGLDSDSDHNLDENNQSESPHLIVTGLEPDTHYYYEFLCYNTSQGTFFEEEDDFWTDEETSSGGDEEEEIVYSWNKLGSTQTQSFQLPFTLDDYEVGRIRFKPPTNGTIKVYTKGNYDMYGWLFYSGGGSLVNGGTGRSTLSGSYLKRNNNSGTGDNFSYTYSSAKANTTYEINIHEYNVGYCKGTLYVDFTPAVTNYTITYALGTASKWSDETTGTKTQNKPSNSSVTLADYKAISNDGTGTKTITFNGNGATSLTKSSQTSKITARYTHNGWSTSSGGSKSYELQGTYSTNENVTLYPTFSSTLSYSNITLPTKSECQRTGYTLLGWATSSSATTAAAVPGAEYSVTSTTSTLYAVWKLDTYNITVDCNGGSGVSSTTYNINSSTITLGKPTRTGYAFCGWTGTEITSPQETVTIPSGSVGNRSYIATWAQLIVFNFKNSDTDLLKNATNTQGIAINWYVSQSQIQDFINKINSYCGTSITLSEWQTLDNYNAIVDALNQSSAPAHFSGTTQPNLVKKSKDDYIKAQDLLDLENAFNNRKFI